MYNIKDEDIQLLLKAIPVIMKIKVNNLEKAVEDCKGIGESYKEIKKFKKSIEKAYKDYKEAMDGLGYLAIGRNEFDKEVNKLLKKYSDSKFYLELVNGNGDNLD